MDEATICPKGLLSKVRSDLDAVTIRPPSGLKLAARTALSVLWVKGPPNGLQLLTSHTCAVLSRDAVTISLPSGLKFAEYTSSLCGSGLPALLPVAASQMRAVLSDDAVAINLPSGLKLAERTEFL